MKKVIVEVYKGCATCAYKDKGIELHIIDLDPLERGEQKDVVIWDAKFKISEEG